MTIPRTPDELSVLAVIQRFSSAIKSNSPDILRSQILPSGSVTRTGIDPSSHVNMCLPDLVSYISAAADKGDIEGRFDPDEVTIKVDGDLAILWAPWRSFDAGKLTHVGSIVFVLAKGREERKWIIVSCADNLVAVG